MMPRVTTSISVSALLRSVQAAGGTGMVLKKGDATAGGVLLLCSERGVERALLERTLGPGANYGWQRIGPNDVAERASYLARRQARDRDLWVVELDIAESERFAAESAAFN